MSTIVILHGTKGSPDGNWFPWLKKELEERGHKVYVPKLPTPENQSKDNWCKALDKQAPIFDNDTILIGHSCGAVYLLHILESLSTSIKQSIFVSGFLDSLGDSEYDELNKTFINHSFDWNKIKNNAGSITVFHGSNDPFVPLSQAEKLCSNLSTKVNIISNGGHLNSASGYTKFKELSDIIL
jgi:predicted alpha/beta hydrolase family esterase